MSDLSPKENLMRVLNHKIPGWIPNVRKEIINYWPAELAERAPGNGSPQQALGGTGFDWFGVHWTFQEENGSSMVSHEYPALLIDITQWRECVKFPDLDAIDWGAAYKRDAHIFNPEKVVCVTLLNGMFERLHSLMGMEEACCALLLEPEEVYDFFEAVANHKIKLMEKLITNFPIDLIEIHDDWGHKNNSFFSPELWSRLLKPHVKRLTDYGRERGIKLRFHSCGKVDNLMDLMVEAGIENWSSAQTVNDIESIIKRYGDRLVIAGGMDLQIFTSPGMTDEKMDAIVAERIDNLCRGGAFLPYGTSSIPPLNASIERVLEARRDFFKNPENHKIPA